MFVSLFVLLLCLISQSREDSFDLKLKYKSGNEIVQYKNNNFPNFVTSFQNVLKSKEKILNSNKYEKNNLFHDLVKRVKRQQTIKVTGEFKSKSISQVVASKTSSKKPTVRTASTTKKFTIPALKINPQFVTLSTKPIILKLLKLGDIKNIFVSSTKISKISSPTPSKPRYISESTKKSTTVLNNTTSKELVTQATLASTIKESKIKKKKKKLNGIEFFKHLNKYHYTPDDPPQDNPPPSYLKGQQHHGYLRYVNEGRYNVRGKRITKAKKQIELTSNGEITTQSSNNSKDTLNSIITVATTLKDDVQTIRKNTTSVVNNGTKEEEDDDEHNDDDSDEEHESKEIIIVKVVEPSSHENDNEQRPMVNHYLGQQPSMKNNYLGQQPMANPYLGQQSIPNHYLGQQPSMTNNYLGQQSIPNNYLGQQSMVHNYLGQQPMPNSYLGQQLRHPTPHHEQPPYLEHK